jgi:hypothetical protein
MKHNLNFIVFLVKLDSGSSYIDVLYIERNTNIIIYGFVQRGICNVIIFETISI